MGQSSMTMAARPGALMEESPYGIQSKKLAMWLFIIADAATFGAILFAYGYLRVANPDWTKPFAFWPTIASGSAMTLALLTSSLTMAGAVRSAQAGRKSVSVGWLGATMALGLAFALLLLHEWSDMIGAGWRLSHNPLGGSVLFGATFFGITGLHLLHVICGVVALAVIAIGFNRDRLDAGHVETTGLYWHFVNVVQMVRLPVALSDERPLSRTRAKGEAMAEAEQSAGMQRYVIVWFGLILIVAVEVFLTYQHLPVGKLLASLLVLAFIGAGVGAMYFMHLRYERVSLSWSLIPYLIFALVMMDHVWPDALRLMHQRLSAP